MPAIVAWVAANIPAILTAVMAAYAVWRASPNIINTLRQLGAVREMIRNWLAKTTATLPPEATREDAFALDQAAGGQARAAALEQITLYTQATFASMAGVQAGYDEFLVLYRAGVITQADMAPVATPSLREQDRLAAGVPAAGAPPAAVAAPTPVTVNVAAPIVTVTAPAVHVDTAPLAAAIPIAAATAVSATMAMAKTWGHDVATGQRSCWQSTFVDMLGSLVGPAATLAMLNLPEQWSPLKQAMNGIVDHTFKDIFESPSLQAPVTPEAAPAIAKDLFRKAMELGVQAQLISITAEMFQPAKMLGFGYLAAFLGDMAGFAKIGGAMMGVIETQAIARPFGYYTNAKVRSVLPDLRQAMSLLGARQITAAQFEQLAAYSGMAPEYTAGFVDLASRPATGRMLGQIADMGIFDERYMKSELEHGEYNDATVGYMLTMLERRAGGELKVLFTGSALKRFREGQDNESELRRNLTYLGVADELMPKYVYAANLERGYDQWTLDQKALQEKPKELAPVMLSTAIKRYKEGLDGEPQFTEHLIFLGIDARLLPRYVYAADLERDYDDMMDYLATLKDAVTRGAIEPDSMKQLLVRRGMSEAKASLYAERSALSLLKAAPKV